MSSNKKGKEKKIIDVEPEDAGSKKVETKNNKVEYIEEENEDSDDFSSDFKSLGDNLLSVLKSKWFIAVLLLLIVGFTTFHYRIGPYNLKSIDGMVEQNVDSFAKSLIENEVNAMQIAPMEKVNLKNQFFKDFKSGKEISLSSGTLTRQELVSMQSQVYKEQFMLNKTPYLLAIDPYYYARRARDILDKGYFGTYVENENGETELMDTLRKAPNGVPVGNMNMHTNVEALSYKLMYGDSKVTDEKLFNAIYLLPVIFSVVAVLFFFLILKPFIGNFASFFASIALGLSGTFLSRTMAGFVDTDPYNVFFPIISLFFLLYGFLSKNKILKYSLIGISGVIQALFLSFWGPASFFFIFVNLAFVVYLVYEILVHLFGNKINLKITISEIITYNAFSISFGFLFGHNLIQKSLGLFNMTAVQNALARGSLWPNILTSVAELSSASYKNMLTSLANGNLLVLFLSFVGPLFFIKFLFKDNEAHKNNFKVRRNRIFFLGSLVWYALFVLVIKGINIPIFSQIYSLSTINRTLSQMLFVIIFYVPYIYEFFSLAHKKIFDKKFFLVVLTLVWFAGTQFMVLKGVRFLLLAATPFAIAFGMSIPYLVMLASKLYKSMEVNSKWVAKASVYVLVFLMIIPYFTSAQKVGMGSLPNVNDAWYDTLKGISEYDDAIITSWWDFGHFFIYFSENGATFDGASQNTPRAYWVGRLLRSKSENESLGILRMLDCSGNDAYDYYYNYSGNHLESFRAIEKMASFYNGSKIESYLNDNTDMTDEQISEMKELMFCENPPESFVIASEDMVGKSGVWARWGSWDFDKAYIFQNRKSLSESEVMDLGYSELEAKNLLNRAKMIESETDANYWISPVKSYGSIASCQESDGFYFCENNVIMDKNSSMPYIAIADGCAKSSDEFVCKGSKYSSENRKLFGSVLAELPYSIVSQVPDVKEFVLNEDSSYSVLFFNSGNDIQSMILSKELSTSLFTKMFFFNGKGLSKFNMTSQESGMGSGKILTYKVNW